MKITPLWAAGKHAEQVQDISLHPEITAYQFFMVDLSDLINKVDFINRSPDKLFVGDDASDTRIVTTLVQWEQNGFIDPPTVTTHEEQGKLKILDGRHRTIAAFHLAQKSIPIAVHKTLVERVGRIIQLAPIS